MNRNLQSTTTTKNMPWVHWKQKEKVFIEPIAREIIDCEPVERVTVIKEPVSAEERTARRKVVSKEPKELKQGSAKAFFEKLKNSSRSM
ncbi:hypothetical protein GEMRC1_012631 [Eukaryota sp. GEM-RC1]